MKTLSFSGIIKLEYDCWFKIKLIQDDGFKLDLVSRFREASESYPNTSIQVSYYLSDKPCSKNEMLEGWLNKISGGIEADYEANGYAYSSWTTGTDYDTVLRVGCHDLYEELLQHEGKFIIVEIQF